MKLVEKFKNPNVWIPSAFVGMFLVIIAANGAMVGVAMGTWRGLHTENAYEKGVAYNETLENERRQRALGWDVALETENLGDSRADLEVRLSDGDGAPVLAERVRVGFVRPTQEGYDHIVELPRRRDGVYGAIVEVPLPGLWELRVAAERGQDAVRTTERVNIAP
ncbi:FixH family protein [Ferruginivarius sediminum]|uniref:Nitrogen fixation protein FixH n=1 Tax=Ferruginivarius sediminum TaxID=2661937 RepID=A0A369T787_9PROT|nr:FixH family protein [Ferruginivarius sediminum]RDD61138.1 hypothetical protein DRB17_14680 [Ferruginivarius sediminum]